MDHRERQPLRLSAGTIVADVEKKVTLRDRGYGIDSNFWRSIRDTHNNPSDPKRRVGWGSLLFATVDGKSVLSDSGYMCLPPRGIRTDDQIWLLLGVHVF